MSQHVDRERVSRNNVHEQSTEHSLDKVVSPPSLSPPPFQLKASTLEEEEEGKQESMQMMEAGEGFASPVAPPEDDSDPSDGENNTGLPSQLKAGIENLSGYSLDDVKVHYNSSKPAQLSAHAYAQGSDIHLASGQEKHLPHEAWHVVQQKQGRVRPTMQMKGNVNVNDDEGLEREADEMGAKALQMKPDDEQIQKNSALQTANLDKQPVQRSQVVQLALDQARAYRASKEITGYKDTTRKTTVTIKKGDVLMVKNNLDNEIELVLKVGGSGTVFIDKTDEGDLEAEPRLEEYGENELKSNTELIKGDKNIGYQDFYLSKEERDQTIYKPEDARQGNVGDCWLLGPMAAMAGSNEWKAKLKEGISDGPGERSFKINDHVYDKDKGNGEELVPQEKVVTGLLPTYKPKNSNKAELLYAGQQQGVPAKFNNSKEKNFPWASIYEKAIAGESYQGLDDKSAKEGLARLGGYMPESLRDFDDKTMEKIAKLLENGAAITVTTKTNNPDDPENKKMVKDPKDLEPQAKNAAKTLLENHVYYVAGIRGGSLKLRNPHGTNHPKVCSLQDAKNFFEVIDILPAPPKEGLQQQQQPDQDLQQNQEVAQQPQENQLNQQQPLIEQEQQQQQIEQEQQQDLNLQQEPEQDQIALALNQNHNQFMLGNEQQMVQGDDQIQNQNLHQEVLNAIEQEDENNGEEMIKKKVKLNPEN